MFPKARHKSPTSERKNPLLLTLVFGFLTLRQQSCSNRNEHVPVLSVVQNVEELEHIYFGYHCIADFCASIFEHDARVRKQEWFIVQFVSRFDFVPILQWLYKQQKFVPKLVLLRDNKVISMRGGNKRFIDSYLFIPIPLANFP